MGAALYSSDLRYHSTAGFRNYDDGWRVVQSAPHSGQTLDDALKNAKPAPPPDPRKRNTDAMSALVAAYPELRKPFHGVLVYAEIPGHQPITTEQAMAEIK